MAYPTAVIDQITDSITQVNTEVLAESPAMSTGELMIATSQALANAAHNATSNQQNMVITSQAANVTGVANLYSLDTASEGESTGKILGLHIPAPGTV